MFTRAGPVFSEHPPELMAKARQVNDRLLMIERAGQGCAIGSALWAHPPALTHGRANEPGPSASGTNAPWA